MAATPFFSQDERWLGFYSTSERRLKQLPRDGRLCDYDLQRRFGQPADDCIALIVNGEVSSWTRRKATAQVTFNGDLISAGLAAMSSVLTTRPRDLHPQR